MYRLDFLFRGFEDYYHTASDHGADILVNYGTKLMLVQCKFSEDGNAFISPSQLDGAISGREFYQADYTCVVTNVLFSPEAIKTAAFFDIYLFDKDVLELLRNAADPNDRAAGEIRDEEIRKRIPFTPATFSMQSLAHRYVCRCRRKKFTKNKNAGPRAQTNN